MSLSVPDKVQLTAKRPALPLMFPFILSGHMNVTVIRLFCFLVSFSGTFCLPSRAIIVDFSRLRGV